ncbi:DUF2231 domain-containing protein [Oscillatoria sp. FACHB-1406]|uniref:DUF2231 domain-containing protein n=1 Tax=Oscillatoria sp. FACHB-1406 TaxID=2692846 RepID=UPI00322098CD
MLLLTLNDKNLPYPDPLHPIIVHFVIAMVFFAYFCDLVGYLSRKPTWLEVSWWNLLVASVAIFFAVIFGEFEAGLAEPYTAAQTALDWHTITGWSLSAILVGITAWRGVLRRQNPGKIPVVYLGVATLLVVLVFFQMYLGDLLAWVYGLHSPFVVKAIREGTLK